jgi:16S rRNA (uracil1498-N3)-methyltransferase
MQLFFNPDLAPDAKSFVFDREESRHMIKVLRKKEGDIIQITNGKGCFFDAEITLASDHKCTVSITSVIHVEKRPYNIHLAVAPTKMNDRYEWFLEKATEIGIDRVTPVICDRSERKVIKTDRLEKIVLSALKQSGQAYLPVVDEPISFSQFIKNHQDGKRFIAHCEPEEKKTLKSEIIPGEDILMLIGPEGDFSPPEINLALQNGFVPVSLGSTRLRTETAAVVACHSIVFANE